MTLPKIIVSLEYLFEIRVSVEPISGIRPVISGLLVIRH
jgi:hypothetical protein